MIETCKRCGEPLRPGVTMGAVHVACPTAEQLERRRRLGRGPDHVAQLVKLYPAGTRGRYV